MIEKRITVGQLVVGDVLVTTKTGITGCVVELGVGQAGTALRGPRGGRKVLLETGSRITVKVASGRGFAALPTAAVTVLRVAE